MGSSGDDEAVPRSMIPLLEVAYRKREEEEQETTQGKGQKSSWLTRQEQEEAGKKRKRSSNWSESETLQLLLLRKAQLQSKEDRKPCPKGSSAWDQIALQLKETFSARSGKHVGERWDTLRRVYMDIEEHCYKNSETYADVLDANRDLYKFIPTEYTQKWHELIAECKPGKRRGKKNKEVVSLQHVVTSPQIEATPSKARPALEDHSVTSHKSPLRESSQGNLDPMRLERATADATHNEVILSESSPSSVAQSSQIASAFDALIRNLEYMFSFQSHQEHVSQNCEREVPRESADGDERVEVTVKEHTENRCDRMKMNVLASLQSVLAALKDASKYTSSESYLLKIDKREWHLVERNVSAFSERHKNNLESPDRFDCTDEPFKKVVWPPDGPDSVTVTHDELKVS